MSHIYRDRPVQWFETAHIQGHPVLGAGVMMEQPAADAGAAVGVFTGRLQGALQHVSTHTAQETLIHIAYKPLQIIAHPTTTQTDYTEMAKVKGRTQISHLFLLCLKARHCRQTHLSFMVW